MAKDKEKQIIKKKVTKSLSMQIPYLITSSSCLEVHVLSNLCYPVIKS